MVARLGITVIPINIHFGMEAFKDNVTIGPDEFYARLAVSPETPTTSQVPPTEFRQTYDALGAEADGIVSVHLSSRLSGTYGAAVQGAASTSAPCPVEVIDSEQSTMGLGLVVIAAAEAAGRGAGHDEVVSTARDAVSRAQSLCLFDTLEYLVRGGRIGRAQGLVGSMLRVRPMIIVRDGEIQSLGRARTFSRGLRMLEERARALAPIESLAVMHSTTPDIAREVADDLSDLLPEGSAPYVARFGPALGVYCGPGAIGISLLQAGVPARPG